MRRSDKVTPATQPISMKQSSYDDELVNAQTEVVNLFTMINECNRANQPAFEWSSRLISYLQKLCKKFTLGDEYKSSDLPFAFCITGEHVWGLANPYTKIKAFIIVENSADVDLLKTCMSVFANFCNNVAAFSDSQLLCFSDEGITPFNICDTIDQIMIQANNFESQAYIHNLYTAIVICGKPQLLFELKKQLSQKRIYSNGKLYHDIGSFYYDKSLLPQLALSPFDLNLLVIQPLLFILNGICYEFEIKENILAKTLIQLLEQQKHISTDVANLLFTTMTKLSQFIWEKGCTKTKFDTIGLTEDRELLMSFYDTVNQLRDIIVKRIKTRRNTISLYQKRTIALMFEKKRAADDSLKPLDTIELFLTRQAEQLVSGEVDHYGKAMRLFNDNNIIIPRNFILFMKTLYHCVHNGNILKSKFDCWLWTALPSCSHELFDDNGELFSPIKEILDTKRWYSSAIAAFGKAQINKALLFSYFMNTLFVLIAEDKRFLELNVYSSKKNPEMPLLFNVQQYVNAFFDNYILKETYHLSSLNSFNYHAALLSISTSLTFLIEKLQRLIDQKGLNNSEITLYKYYADSVNEGEHTLVYLRNSLNNILAAESSETLKVTEFNKHIQRIVAVLSSFQTEIHRVSQIFTDRMRHQLFVNEDFKFDSVNHFIDKIKQEIEFYNSDVLIAKSEKTMRLM